MAELKSCNKNTSHILREISQDKSSLRIRKYMANKKQYKCKVIKFENQGRKRLMLSR